MQVHTPVTETGTTAPSDPVIPAVRGEFYSYSTEFTTERPLGFLMKCRANKGRSITDALDYAHEHDLTFVFSANGVQVCSPNAAPSIELLGDIVVTSELNQTMIARADITETEFNRLRQQKNGPDLAVFCCKAVQRSENVLTLTTGAVIAVATESGKYGLLRVTELTPSSVRVDACHILL